MVKVAHQPMLCVDARLQNASSLAIERGMPFLLFMARSRNPDEF